MFIYSHRTFQIAPLLIAAMMAGCTGGAAVKSADNDNAAAFMPTYGLFKAAWNNHDAAGIASYFAPDGTYSTPTTGGPISGPAIAGFTGALFTAIPDFHVQVLSAHPIDSTTIAERWVVTGTWTQPFPGGPLMGTPPTGKSFTLPGAGYLVVANGKIRSDTSYFDQMAFLGQLGLLAKK
jgi:steroid delta-isomerase-like uncharacterized protein